MANLQSVYRSYTCNELRTSYVGQEVTLSGWVQRKRDHGGVVFIDLRDHYGVTQVVFPGEGRELIQETRPESVVCVKGVVVKRADDMINPKIETGEIEVHASRIEVLSASEVLPFQVAEDDKAPEPIRLKSRFIELRRDKLHRNIVLRSQIVRQLRESMTEQGFMEIQTPILTSSSPEGARDFIVPSRLHPGKFFALPQAPQQFKQLLMISGFDRYFQIAPCFRDEDPRADRSPGEFYQLDMELSFVEQDQVLAVNEKVIADTFSRFSDWPMTAVPFPRIRYETAMAKYGTDKPDLRIMLEIEDVSALFQNTEFRVFRSALEQRGSVRAIRLEVPELPPRKYFDDLIEYFKRESGSGLAYLSFEGGAHKGSIAKFFSESEVEALRSKFAGSQVTVLFFAAGPDAQILPALGKLRVKLGREFDRLEKNSWRWCWITDFPMYVRDERSGAIQFNHNPFSMPQGELEALNTKDPLDIYAYQYDLVCNGYELASGAIRNHKPEIMYRAFEIAGYSRETVDEKFGGMIRAFRYGAPPHGGIGHGVERIVMLLAGEEAIREVIPFPLSQSAEDLMMGAPSEISEQQLAEAHIEVKLPEPEPKAG